MSMLNVLYFHIKQTDFHRLRCSLAFRELVLDSSKLTGFLMRMGFHQCLSHFRYLQSCFPSVMISHLTCMSSGNFYSFSYLMFPMTFPFMQSLYSLISTTENSLGSILHFFPLFCVCRDFSGSTQRRSILGL